MGHSPWPPGSGGLRACIPESHRTNNQRESSRTLPHPGQCTNSRLKHNPSLRTGLFTCSGTSAWGAGLGFPTHLEAMVVLSGNSGQGTSSLYCFYASLQLAGTFQRKVYALVWSFKFCNSNPGNTSKLPALEASRVYDLGPWDCIYEHTLKTITWASDFHSAQN